MASCPVRVEYQLTPMGREFEPVLEAVIAWSHKWIPLPAGVDDTDSYPVDMSASDSREEMLRKSGRQQQSEAAVESPPEAVVAVVDEKTDRTGR